MSLKSILIGAAVGAGVALLYAPASGRATRAKIRDKAQGMGHDITDYVEGKKQHLNNKMEGIKAKARKMTGAMQDRMQDAMSHDADTRDMSMVGEPSI